MGEDDVETKNTCEGWYMCNANVRNHSLTTKGFCHHLLEKGNKEPKLRTKTLKWYINKGEKDDKKT